MPQTIESARNSAPAGRILGDSAVRIWGMTARQRLERIFRRVGIAADAPAAEGVVVVLGTWVYDESLIKTLAARPG